MKTCESVLILIYYTHSLTLAHRTHIARTHTHTSHTEWICRADRPRRFVLLFCCWVVVVLKSLLLPSLQLGATARKTTFKNFCVSYYMKRETTHAHRTIFRRQTIMKSWQTTTSTWQEADHSFCKQTLRGGQSLTGERKDTVEHERLAAERANLKVVQIRLSCSFCWFRWDPFVCQSAWRMDKSGHHPCVCLCVSTPSRLKLMESFQIHPKRNFPLFTWLQLHSNFLQLLPPHIIKWVSLFLRTNFLSHSSIAISSLSTFTPFFDCVFFHISDVIGIISYYFPAHTHAHT